MFEQLSSIEERPTVSSEAWVENMDRKREGKNFITKIATALAKEVLDIPQGSFSGIVTYLENGEEKRISPALDKLMAEMFTNQRYIVKKLNKKGHITTKNLLAKYVGEIDEVIKQTKEDLATYKTKVEDIKEKLKQENLSEAGRKKAEQLLKDSLEVFRILELELELKKRGYEFLGEEKIEGRMLFLYQNYINTNLEIQHLPGGYISINKGYFHNDRWQKNFGDSRFQDFGLAQIYQNVKYVAIETVCREKYGDSLQACWSSMMSKNEHYDRLMKELVKENFKGVFLEIDSRYEGSKGEKTFDVINLLDREAQKLFQFVRKYNPQLAEETGGWQRFREFFHKQRTQNNPPLSGLPALKENLAIRGINEGVSFIQQGTGFSNTASVDKNLQTSTNPTGFELGSVAFADALSVVKTLILANAMHKGELETGIIVDFQGSAHLSYKSYFFNNPQYALEVVLTNVWEVLASHPDIKNREDILDKLENMDRKTWKWVLEFISTIHQARVASPTKWKNTVESSILGRQRPMQKLPAYSALNHLSKEQEEKMNEILDNLAEKNKVELKKAT